MNEKQININNQQIWEANAKDWDSFMGDKGNDWHKELIAPETERLLNLKTGQTLLDIGCGNGLFARKMSGKGITVTAFDFSKSNIENAKRYDSYNIDYLVLDATNNDNLSKLEKKKYDGLVANMFFMDMPNIKSLFCHIKNLLTDDGSFVFSIQHPCFNSEYVDVTDNTLIIKDYINSSMSKGFAIPEQSEEQYYFHRPINYYINLGIKNGLAVTACVEPTFKSKKVSIYSKIPPILIIRMNKINH